MAQKVVTTLVSDQSGKELKPGDGETLTFALDGVQYETDLSNEEAKEFRSILAPYVNAARRTGGRKARPASAKTDKEQLQAMREWGQKNGFKVSSRGRVAQEVKDAFHAAMSS